MMDLEEEKVPKNSNSKNYSMSTQCIMANNDDSLSLSSGDGDHRASASIDEEIWKHNKFSKLTPIIRSQKPPTIKNHPFVSIFKNELGLYEKKKDTYSNQSTDNSIEMTKNNSEKPVLNPEQKRDTSILGPKLTLKNVDQMKKFPLPFKSKMGNFPNPLLQKKSGGLFFPPSKFDDFFKSPSSVLSQNYVLKGLGEKTLKTDQIFEKDFEKLKILGNGNFSSVYQCRHKATGLMYAIKVTKNTIKSVKSQGQILNEAQLLAFFSSFEDTSNIVKYYNSWIEEKELFIQMEYCDFSLEQLMKKQSFSEKEVIKVLKDIAMGLKSLHGNNVVHLDIKPDNILYSKKKDIFKLGDLGLCRFSTINKGEDVIEGDSRYLAQELLNIDSYEMRDLTKADIFSLGTSIYEIMIGENIPSNGEEWQQIRKGIIPKLIASPKYSNQLKSLVQRMMHPNFKLRPSAEEILKNPIFITEKEYEIRWMRIKSDIIKERTKELTVQINEKRRYSFDL